MTTFWRSEHYRNGSFVEGHWVTRDDWGRFDSSHYNIGQTRFASFTTPNATCPVCGESVFYYENSYGSKVWFDELGPPWPIHGCFEENVSSPVSTEVSRQKESEMTTDEPHSLVIDIPSETGVQMEPQRKKASLISKPGVLSLTKPLKNIDSVSGSWFRRMPCIPQKEIKRADRLYVTVAVFDEYKKENIRYFIFESPPVSLLNHICFLCSYNKGGHEIAYFDIGNMMDGATKGVEVGDYNTLLFLSKYKQRNTENLERVRAYADKSKSLQKHVKISLADWLYSNTVFDKFSLSVFSGLGDFEINLLVNDRLKSSHTPQSPVSLGLIDDDAFSLLMKSINCIHTVL